MKKLGIDVGSNSLAWSIIIDNKPTDGGVLNFSPGVLNLNTYNELSKNANRTLNRSARKLVHRKRILKNELLKSLVGYNMCPLNINEIPSLRRGDLRINNKYTHIVKWIDLNPYELRDRAIKNQITLDEIGRILYHISENRGFQSNSKTTSTEDKGAIYNGYGEIKGINDTNDLCANHDTIGSALYNILPKKGVTNDKSLPKIKGRFTKREMYINELNIIFSEQSKYYPHLLSIKQELMDILFFQRKLKSQKNLIGKCTLEPTKKRCPKTAVIFERARAFQFANSIMCDGTQLDDVQRLQVVDLLLSNPSVKFKDIKRNLNLKTSVFNYEDDTKIIGSYTIYNICKYTGKTQDQVIDNVNNGLWFDLYTYDDEYKLKDRLVNVYGLSEDNAKALSKLNFKTGYSDLSRNAICKIYPYLEQGFTYDKAVVKAGYSSHSMFNTKMVERLPMGGADKDIKVIRNPVVITSVIETRKIVNSLLDKYGQIDEIRIELGREVKANNEGRLQIIETQKSNQKKNDEVKSILQKNKVDVKFNNILKYKLWEELGGDLKTKKHATCVYTGKPIPFNIVFSPDSNVEIEHINPFSRTINDSFMNKTLCYSSDNKDKNNKTPFEWLGNDKHNWDIFIKRAESVFKNTNFKKFLHITDTKPLTQSFKSSQLNDTRYAGVFIKDYLKQVCKKVYVTNGMVTSKLRSFWDLNTILSSGDIKTRDDHRHHLIDAIVIGSTTNNIINNLTNRSNRNIPIPCKNFRDIVANLVDSTLVVHKQNNKVTSKNNKGVSARGQLHDATLYGKRIVIEKGSVQKEVYRVRKSLKSITTLSQIEKIADEGTKRIIKERLLQDTKFKLDSNGIIIGKKISEDENGNPIMMKNNKPKMENLKLPEDLFFTKIDGIEQPMIFKGNVPVLKVRMNCNMSNAIQLGHDKISKKPNRWVEPGNNHHAIIYTNSKGKFDSEVISFFEANKRINNKQDVYQTPKGTELITTIKGNDLFVLGHPDHNNIDYNNKAEIRKYLYKVQKISKNDFCFRKVEDSRMDKDANKDYIKIKSGIKWLEYNPVKVNLDKLGCCYPLL